MGNNCSVPRVPHGTFVRGTPRGWHAIAVSGCVEQFQELHKHADRVLLLRTPGDAAVRNAGPVQGQIIGIEGDCDPLLSRSERELIAVGQLAPVNLLGRQNVRCPGDGGLPSRDRGNADPCNSGRHQPRSFPFSSAGISDGQLASAQWAHSSSSRKSFSISWGLS